MTINGIVALALPLGKGEVVSSILPGSTRKAPKNRSFVARALPFPPGFGPERRVNSPQRLGGDLVGPTDMARAGQRAPGASARARASPTPKMKRPVLPTPTLSERRNLSAGNRQPTIAPRDS